MTAADASLERLTAARQEVLVGALEAIDGTRPTVNGFRLATGGNSHECWIADVVRNGAPSRLVLRCDPDDWIRPDEMAREVLGLQIAAHVGVPAPMLMATHDDFPADRPYTVVQFVAGDAIATKIHRDPAFEQARSVFAEQCGTILAQLRTAPAELVQRLEPRPPVGEVRHRLGLVTQPAPVLVGAVEWLAANAPAPVPDAPVHGDFRLGNMMLDTDGVRAVLDWETAHRGDPYEDLAWVCQRAWRYGGSQPVGGIGSLDDLFAAYTAGTGEPVDLDRFHWWLVWGATFWALASREQSVAERGRAGDSMESAAIARQTCVQEANVLAELERYVS